MWTQHGQLSREDKTIRYTYNATGKRIVMSCSMMESVYINAIVRCISLCRLTLVPNHINSVRTNI